MNDNQEKQIDLSECVANTKLLQTGQFILWSNENIQGAYRKLIFSRNSLLGEISRYYSEDYIIWKYRYPTDYQKIQKEWKGNSSIFLTRFIFLHPSMTFSCKRRSIWFGLRGYLDLIICPFPLVQHDWYRKEIRDITPFLIEHKEKTNL